VPAIKKQLDDEKDPKLRQLWMETLGQIDSPAARSVLVDLSLNDRDLELRLSAVESLAKSKDPGVVKQYVKALKSEKNPVINRAAVGLGAMGDTSAIGPLIDALVTKHKHTIQQGSQAIRTTFGTGGNAPNGLSVGGGAKVINETAMNEEVRNALVELTGVNFNFDVDGWKAWHAVQRQDAAINVRRD
jgi:HEAT repeat protein